jgi:hypothetical protein
MSRTREVLDAAGQFDACGGMDHTCRFKQRRAFGPNLLKKQTIELCCGVLPLKPLKFDAVGLDCRVAEAALLVFFVGFEVAFEPLDMAVAFEG